MTLTLKMRALQAMQAHAKATATQIAAELQHNLPRTRAIIGDLMQAGLARNVGMVDGYTAYEVTEAGLAALAQPEATEPPFAQPAPAALPSITTPRLAQPSGSKPPSRKPTDIDVPTFREQVRFGLLNTNELMILAPGLAPLLLTAATTDSLRELLSRRIV